MSLLMFRVDPTDGIVILTDTLATDVAGNPCRSTTKCRVFPHLNLPMAGTGSGNLLDAWAQRLAEGMLAIDVDMCSVHTPVVLRELWHEICEQHGLEPIVVDPDLDDGRVSGRTATIYQFGQGRDGRFVWYVFRSYNDFEPERWDQGGFAVKPPPVAAFDPDAKAPETLEEMISLGVRIRSEQDALPQEERVFIGGEFWLTAVTSAGFGQTRVHRFDDWVDQWNAMNDHASRS